MLKIFWISLLDIQIVTKLLLKFKFWRFQSLIVEILIWLQPELMLKFKVKFNCNAIWLSLWGRLIFFRIWVRKLSLLPYEGSLLNIGSFWRSFEYLLLFFMGRYCGNRLFVIFFVYRYHRFRLWWVYCDVNVILNNADFEFFGWTYLLKLCLLNLWLLLLLRIRLVNFFLTFLEPKKHRSRFSILFHQFPRLFPFLLSNQLIYRLDILFLFINLIQYFRSLFLKPIKPLRLLFKLPPDLMRIILIRFRWYKFLLIHPLNQLIHLLMLWSKAFLFYSQYVRDLNVGDFRGFQNTRVMVLEFRARRGFQRLESILCGRILLFLSLILLLLDTSVQFNCQAFLFLIWLCYSNFLHHLVRFLLEWF